MKKPLSLDIKGIKCDNKNCDYDEPNVSAEDYHQWLNKPCPKCGTNLLTQADFKVVASMIKAVTFLSRFLPKIEGEEMVTISIDMDGTGSIQIGGKNDA